MSPPIEPHSNSAVSIELASEHVDIQHNIALADLKFTNCNLYVYIYTHTMYMYVGRELHPKQRTARGLSGVLN